MGTRESRQHHKRGTPCSEGVSGEEIAVCKGRLEVAQEEARVAAAMGERGAAATAVAKERLWLRISFLEFLERAPRDGAHGRSPSAAPFEAGCTVFKLSGSQSVCRAGCTEEA